MDSRMDPMGRRRTARLDSAMLRIRIRFRVRNGRAEPVATPLVNIAQGPGPASGSIMFYHQAPAIPRSLTPTGSLIVYLLREQLSRSPPPSPAPQTWTTTRQNHRYTVQARRVFFFTIQNLRRADALLGRGLQHPETPQMISGEVIQTLSIARSIVQCLRLLQTRTRPPAESCLLCRRHPAMPRAPEDASATDILEVRSNQFFSAAGYLTVDAVTILPPIRDFDPPMLCAFHRYLFQFLMYQVVSPSWPVPYLQEDMASFGQIAVDLWDPATQILQFI